MARKRRPNEKSSYRTAPAVPAELSRRYEAVAQVIAGQLSVSDGARQLGMARPNFQTLVNRTKAAMVETLSPRPSGPTPTPREEIALSKEVEALRRDNERLTHQLHTMDRLLGAAGEVIQELRHPERTKTSRSSSRRSTRPSNEDDEGPPAPTTTCPRSTGARAPMMKVLAMHEPGATWARHARALGMGASTLRRHARHGPPSPRRPRSMPPSTDAMLAVRSLVRELRGLAGAEALARSVGISRRQAAALKQSELTAVERDRKATATRVEVLSPAVVRGFDAMEVATTAGRRYLLVAGDAHVPYRTSIAMVERYDSAAVAAALEADFDQTGAPLVLRLDRARCHQAPPVVAVLRRYGVLPLHGPPRHPRYYGQLERQNREHRAWLASHPTYAPDELAADSAHMRTVLNRMWRRPTLDWRTAECVWRERGPVVVDRRVLAEEVADGTNRRLAAGLSPLLAPRLAIEHALTRRGLLRITPKPELLCAH